MTNSVAFLDPRVANYGELSATFVLSDEVAVLDASEHGVQQIVQYLEGRSEIETVHIVSRCGFAGIQLGSPEFGSSTLPACENLLAEIRSDLSHEADVLLYACNLAGGLGCKRSSNKCWYRPEPQMRSRLSGDLGQTVCQ